jgi:hypothetical protein
MAITHRCDYCEKEEVEVGFVQHFSAVPKRRLDGSSFAARGVRVLDLCGECANLLTRPAEGSERYTGMPVPPPKPAPEPQPDPEDKPKATPVVVFDGSGRRPIQRIRNRPGRCPAYHPKSKSRCFWDALPAHNVHEAANGQRWADDVARKKA